MNRMIYFGLAAVATLSLAQPTYAKKGGGGRGGGGGAKAAHFSAPKGGGGKVAHFSAPKGGGGRMAKFSAPKGGGVRMAKFSAPKGGGRVAKFSAPKGGRGPTMAMMGSRGKNFAEPKGQARGFVAPGKNQAPGAVAQARGGRNSTLAFGGTQRGNTNNLAFRPPNDVSRGWDHGRMQTWNHHHYRWDNGNWVILDGGFYGGYPDGYYDSGTPYFNYDSGYNAPAYGSGSIVANVQNALDQMGYNAGPPDGAMGPQTENALAGFQRDHQLPVTGQIDNPTVQALGL